MTELANRRENVLVSLVWSDGDFYEFVALTEYPPKIDAARLVTVDFRPGSGVSPQEIARALFLNL